MSTAPTDLGAVRAARAAANERPAHPVLGMLALTLRAAVKAGFATEARAITDRILPTEKGRSA